MKRYTNRGFTLIELMIVVVIIGVIAAISYPLYTQWVLETRRIDAHRALTGLAAIQEKFLTECNRYATNAEITPGTITNCGGLGLPTTSPDGHYTVSITAVTTTSFLAQAAPVATSPQANDTKCPNIFLDSLSQKTPTLCW